MPFIPSKEILLPIGFEKDGERYREVIIDEMKGIDNQNLSTRENRKNGAKAVTTLLRRCIQEIPGVLKEKSSSRLLISREYTRDMYTPDRDFILMNVISLNKETEFTAKHQCPSCGQINDRDVDLLDIDIHDLEEGEPPVFEGDLAVDFTHNGTTYEGFRWTFPKGSVAERVARRAEGEQPLETIRLCCVLLAPEGEELKPSSDVVEMMPSECIQDILSQAKEQTPGPDLTRKVICDNERCGDEFEGEIDLTNFLQSKKKPQRTKYRRKLKRKKRGS
jgi:hypothetical protein